MAKRVLNPFLLLVYADLVGRDIGIRLAGKGEYATDSGSVGENASQWPNANGIVDLTMFCATKARWFCPAVVLDTPAWTNKGLINGCDGNTDQNHNTGKVQIANHNANWTR